MTAGATYILVNGGKGIYCRICGSVSFHPEDVANLYCGSCHSFHADLAMPKPPQPARPGFVDRITGLLRKLGS